MKMVCYTLKGVSYAYHTHQEIIRNLSIHVPEGKVTAILGPNGIGKTTFLHIALGWLKPLEGEVTLHGTSLGRYSRRDLGKAVSLVPQNEHISFDYSVLEYVLLGRTPYLRPLALPGDEDVAVAREALETAGIAHLEHKPVHELSGGEAQMMLLARSLAQQPRVILMDEPTSHLDLANKGKVFDLVRSLSFRGVSVLLTSHEPDEAFAVSDFTILIGKGGLVMAGDTPEVMSAENLQRIYGVPIRVEKVNGHTHFIWYQCKG
ncbi:MAG: ABC transporter ATP-binding protein [Spirochaetales bacterium]|nr:ABC transporter ATP-binding protein [Spirochaetales bacterium]